MNKTFNRSLYALCLSGCLIGAHEASADTVQITASVAADTTWYSTNEYVLNGFVYVLQGASLTIEAGTVIKAKPGTDANTSCLIVTTGAKIFANGTRTRPIIFTAEADDVTDPDDLPVFQRGLWGGVVLMGKAVLNTPSDIDGAAASPKYDVFEALPASTQVNGQFVNRFGGNDDDDSSGVMRYVSIRHGGVVFTPNKELNGMSLCAVGRGTVIENIESYAAADDGFEFFGGTVNTKYLVSAFNDDDCFDTDQGYRGKNQFWFSIQEPGKKDNGGEWNGEPSGIAASNAPLATFTVYNATLIGAGTNTSGNNGLTIREYSAPHVYNSILTEFGGNGVRITDVRSGSFLTNGTLDLRDNIWWNFATNGVPVNVAGAGAALLFEDTSRSNEVVNPMLLGISRAADGGLDPRPGPGSPALTSLRTPPNDGFFTPVAYKGAFDGNDLWINGWTFLSQKGFVPASGANTIQVVGNIAADTTWTRDNEYVLNGFVYVLQGASLTIEAGTVIKAKPGTDANTSCLIVTTGAKIFANGTAHNPIIFTAEADDVTDPESLPLFQRGLWGGVVLMGKAVLNTPSDIDGAAASPKYDVFEALPASTQINGQFVNRFGGNDDDDSSGVMRYVSIRHGGVVFTPNKELNGMSLCAVGRGTVIENIESYAAADDGFEFFGGTVNTKYLVSAFNDDDCFDTDQGYRGKNQFWFSIQEPGKKDNGGEWNGEPSGIAASNAPLATFTVYNATLIGAGTNTSGNNGLTIREYSAPHVYNSILTEFGGNGVRITDVRSGSFLTNGTLDLRDNIWWNFATNGVPVNVAGAGAALLFEDTSRSNEVVNPMLLGISRAADGGLDPRPGPGSPALTSLRTPPNDGFFTPVAYKGAFGAVNWATDWTALGALGVITTAGAGVPAPVSGTPPPDCSPANLSIVTSGSDVTITFTADTGASYQVQSTTDLGGSPIQWTDVGTPLSGTGTLTFSASNGGGFKFFRVVCQ